MSKPKPPGKLFQIGYVVPDLDAALAHFNGTLGAPRFMILRGIVVENGWFRGKDAHIDHSMAFGYVGDLQFEIIQPAAGASTYTEFLDRVPKGGIHHIAYSVDDYDGALNDLVERGYREIQHGTFGATRFGYFESDDDPGTITEIVYLDGPTRDMFKAIKDQTF